MNGWDIEMSEQSIKAELDHLQELTKVMVKHYQKLWMRIYLETFGTISESKELRLLKKRLKKRGLWKNAWWLGYSINASDRIKYFKEVLAGVNHTVGFKRCVTLKDEGY